MQLFLEVQRITKPHNIKIQDMRQNVQAFPCPCPVAMGIFDAWAYPHVRSGNCRETSGRDVILRTNMGIAEKHRWHMWDWVVVVRDAIITTSLVGDIRAEGVVSKTRSAERVLANILANPERCRAAHTVNYQSYVVPIIP